MKIGLVLNSYPSYSETFILSKINGLIDEGFEVVLFVNHPNIPKRIPQKVYTYSNYQKWPIERIINRLYLVLSALLFATKASLKLWFLASNQGLGLAEKLKSVVVSSFILRHPVDYLHFEFATSAVGLELVGKAIGAKVSTSLRGYDIAVRPLKEPGCYDLLWRHIDKVHTISDDLLHLAHLNGLSLQTPYQKITPAIDIRRFKTKKDYSDKEKEIVFTTVARLHWKKGLEYTLQALSIVKARGYNFTYRIFGSGNEFERLKFAAYQLGIADNVEFMGKIPHEQIAEEILKSTIYIQYSVQEGFCNAVLEAQALGLLCIVSDAEGLPENVLHQKTGWVVPKRNPETLANNIIDVLNLPIEKKEVVSKEARKRIVESFNLASQQKEFKTFFTK